MKKLLTLGLTILLSGCVTYYYPETALEDGVYYAEDDPSYVIDSSGYVDASYYPWSSMDYFYLDYYAYPRFGYYGGLSIGIGYGYSPWYYGPRYYGYYSPWYAWHAPYYHHSHYYAWRPYYGHGYKGHGNKHYKRKGNKHRKKKNYRYADNKGKGNGKNARGYKREEYSDEQKRPTGSKGSRSYANGKNSEPVKRYVSTTPSGYSGDRGMEVRSRGTKATGNTRTQPIRREQPTTVKLTPSTKSVSRNNYRSRQSTGSAGEVRYRAGNKQGRSRIEPIESRSSARTVAFANTSAGTTPGGDNAGRYGQAKPGNSAGQRAANSSAGHARSSGSSGRSANRAPSNSSSRSSTGGRRRSNPSASSSIGSKSSSDSSARRKDRN